VLADGDDAIRRHAADHVHAAGGPADFDSLDDRGVASPNDGRRSSTEK
jgi:hypothetical protein